MADIDKAEQALATRLRAEEGESLTPYLCEAKVPTIGVGCTTYADGRAVTMADPPITQAQSDRLLQINVARYINHIAEKVQGVATTNQLLGMAILAYNIGFPAFDTSTVLKCHLAGDYAGAARAFGLFNEYRPDGPGTAKKVSQALTARRAREAAIYLTPDSPDAAPAVAPVQPTRVPQAVAPESSMASSRINQGGAATIATGAGWLASQFDALQPIFEKARHLLIEVCGLDPKYMLPAVLIGIGSAIVYQRISQRWRGWA